MRCCRKWFSRAPLTLVLTSRLVLYDPGRATRDASRLLDDSGHGHRSVSCRVACNYQDSKRLRAKRGIVCVGSHISHSHTCARRVIDYPQVANEHSLYAEVLYASWVAAWRAIFLSQLERSREFTIASHTTNLSATSDASCCSSSLVPLNVKATSFTVAPKAVFKVVAAFRSPSSCITVLWMMRWAKVRFGVPTFAMGCHSSGLRPSSW